MQKQTLVFFIIFGSVYFLEAIGGFYMTTAVVSIEKQFQISSKYSGALVSGSDIGYIPVVLLVSYFCGKGNRVLWIGIGCLLVAVGDIFIGVSNFLFSDQSDVNYFNETKQELERAVNSRASLMNVHAFVEYLSSIGVQNVPPQLTERFSASAYSKSILNYEDMLTAECNAGNLTSEICTSYSRFKDPSKALTNTETLTMRKLSGLPYAVCNTIINGLRKQFVNYKNLRHKTNFGPIITILFGLVILGIGRTVPFSLGLPLIDDNVDKKSLPTCYATMFFIRIFGPVLGLFIGSVTNQYYYRTDVPYGLTSQDPLWIGRWWLGFLVMGGSLMVASGSLIIFSRYVAIQESKKEKDDSSKLKKPDGSCEIINLKSADDGKSKPLRKKSFYAKDPNRDRKTSIKEYWRNAKYIFKSKIYVGSLIGRTLDTFVFRGFFLFLPKYLGVQFGAPQHKVNLYLGRKAAAWVLICSVISVFVPFINSTIGCNSVENSLANSMSGHSLTFSTTCNGQCKCDGMPLYPVCNSRGEPFYSPCHAGCSYFNSLDSENIDKVFQNCNCANTTDKVVSRSYCSQSECSSKLYWYISFMGISGFVGGLSVVPAMIIVLRSVDAKNRSIALGFQGFIVTMPILLGTLLSPFFWGFFIDKNCALWSYPYGTDERGSCTLYNSDSLRLYLHLTNGILR
uniref:Kazal-like domain-containing protein n=1 Tax=Syphacia muris TaxID=451379 RepID=A0A0N5AH05_9BILA